MGMTREEAGAVLELMLATAHTSFSETEKEAVREAVEALKEQQAPSNEELKAHYGKLYKCRRCGLEWYQQAQKYCQECGKAVSFHD